MTLPLPATDIRSSEDWCDEDYLQSKGVKTKQLTVDFRRYQRAYCGIEILKGETVQRVKSYKYAGLSFDDKLTHHTTTQSPTVLPGLRPSVRCPHLACTQSPTVLPGLRPSVRCPHHTCTQCTALRSVFSFTCVEHILLFVLTGAVLGCILALSSVALAPSGLVCLI